MGCPKLHHIRHAAMISNDLMKKIENNRVLKIDFIRYEVPKEYAARIHVGDIHEIKEIRTYQAKINKSIELSQKFKDFLTNYEASYYEILDENGYDELKLLIEEDGQKITLKCGKNMMFRESFPLEANDAILDGGFPKKDYLLRESTKYLDYIIQRVEKRETEG